MIPQESSHSPTPLNFDALIDAYKKSDRRMFFMDYDGTLSPLVDKPEDARPSAELKQLLSKLTSDKKNRVYIISGRDRKSLESWLGDLRVGMSAEHGCFLRPIASITDDSQPTEVGQWTDLIREAGIDVSYKEKIIDVFNSYAKRLKGSVVERKEYAITFHYRLCSKEDRKPIVKELRKELQEIMPQYPNLDILKGRKSLEARLRGTTKGGIIRRILDVNKREGVSFVLCMGDDLTDEDMFAELKADKALKEGVFTCTVNFRGSKAGTSVDSQKQVLRALHELASTGGDTSNNGAE